MTMIAFPFFNDTLHFCFHCVLTAKKIKEERIKYYMANTLTHPPYVDVPRYALCSTHFDLWKQIFFHCELYFYSIADCYSDAVGNYSDTTHNCIKSHTNINFRNSYYVPVCHSEEKNSLWKEPESGKTTYLMNRRAWETLIPFLGAKVSVQRWHTWPISNGRHQLLASPLEQG